MGCRPWCDRVRACQRAKMSVAHILGQRASVTLCGAGRRPGGAAVALVRRSAAGGGAGRGAPQLQRLRGALGFALGFALGLHRSWREIEPNVEHVDPMPRI